MGLTNKANLITSMSKEVVRITPKKEELSVTIRTNLECPECGKVLAQPSALNFHLVKAHKIVKNDAARKLSESRSKSSQTSTDATDCHYHCPCEKCPYMTGKKHFSSMKLLKQHYMKVHGEKKYSCKTCSLGFSLERDCRRHEADCGFTNCSCGLELGSKTSLLAHCKNFSHELPARFKRAPASNKPRIIPVIATGEKGGSENDQKKGDNAVNNQGTGQRNILPRPNMMIIPTGFQNTKGAKVNEPKPPLPIIFIADCRPMLLLEKVKQRNLPIQPMPLNQSATTDECIATDSVDSESADVRRDQDTQTDLLSYLISGKSKRSQSLSRHESLSASTQTSIGNRKRTAVQTQTSGDMILTRAMESARIPVKKQSTGCQVSPRGRGKRKNHSEVETQTGSSTAKRRYRRTAKTKTCDSSAQAVITTSTMSAGTDIIDWNSVGIQSTPTISMSAGTDMMGWNSVGVQSTSTISCNDGNTAKANMCDSSAQAVATTSTMSAGTDMIDWNSIGVQSTSTMTSTDKRTEKTDMCDSSAQAVATTSTMSAGTDMIDWNSVGVQSTSTVTSTDAVNQSMWNPLCDNETQTMALLAELDATLAESISTQTFESYLADNVPVSSQPLLNQTDSSTSTTVSFINTSTTESASQVNLIPGTVNQDSLCDLGFSSTLADNAPRSIQNTSSSMSVGTAAVQAGTTIGQTTNVLSDAHTMTTRQDSRTDPLFGGDYFSIGINTQTDEFLSDSRHAATVETQTTDHGLSLPEFFTAASQTTDVNSGAGQTNTETQTMDEVFQQLFTHMETQTPGPDSFMTDFSFADIETQTNITLENNNNSLQQQQQQAHSVETQFSFNDINTQTSAVSVQADELYLNTVETQTASAFATSPGRQINTETQTLLDSFDDLTPGLQDSHTQTTWNELMKNLA